jgi:putative flippase GtrA
MEIIIKLVKHTWTLRYQFIKYFIVGISGFVLSFSLLVFAKEILDVSAVTATAVIGILMMSFNFLLNKYWSFRNKAMPHKQIVRYLILSAANYVFSIFAMYLFHDRFGWDYKLVNIGTVAMMVSWNFLLFKYWVYKQEVEIMVTGT